MANSPGAATVDWRSLRVRAGVALALAVGLNVGLVLAAAAVGVAPGFLALAVAPVAFLSALGVVGATVTYWLLRRVAGAPERTFVRVAVAVLAVSVLPDLALLRFDPSATVPGVVLLMVMHVVVAAVAVWALVSWRRWGPARRRARHRKVGVTRTGDR